jgi:ubiquinone/menaquinone biosynthesis C-methylase UbiE
MSKIADQRYLKTEQYNDAAKLNDRIQLHVRFSTNPYDWHRWVFDQIAAEPNSRVLEVGCGPGQLWLQNRDRLPAGWRVTLADFSAGMLADAQRALGSFGRPLTFEQADAQALPFADASFDLLIANHMLYHVPDRPRALAEFRRVLRPGGALIAATNGEAHLQELRDLVARFAPELSAWGGSGIEVFSLENGAAQLAPWFAPVELRRFPNALVVTEAAPLSAFILSMNTLAELHGARRAELEAFVERELHSQGGAIHITKDAGLFVARPRSS